jgi:hypothetical protein
MWCPSRRATTGTPPHLGSGEAWLFPTVRAGRRLPAERSRAQDPHGDSRRRQLTVMTVRRGLVGARGVGARHAVAETLALLDVHGGRIGAAPATDVVAFDEAPHLFAELSARRRHVSTAVLRVPEREGVIEASLPCHGATHHRCGASARPGAMTPGPGAPRRSAEVRMCPRAGACTVPRAWQRWAVVPTAPGTGPWILERRRPGGHGRSRGLRTGRPCHARRWLRHATRRGDRVLHLASRGVCTAVGASRAGGGAAPAHPPVNP